MIIDNLLVLIIPHFNFTITAISDNLLTTKIISYDMISIFCF